MASSDKLDSDLKRASTRSFPGYVADRVLSRADFSKDKATSETPAAPTPRTPASGGSGNYFTDVADQRLKKAEEGMKRGGVVKKPAAKKSAPAKKVVAKKRGR